MPFHRLKRVKTMLYKNAYFFNSGRAAIFIACSTIVDKFNKRNKFPSEKNRPEIIIPAYSCIVVRNSVEAAGAKPVLVDIRRDNLQYDLSKLEDAIGEDTTAIITQSIFGQSDFSDVEYIKKNYSNLCVIQDHAHLPLDTKNCLADFRIHSFEQSKPSTCWTGGCLVVSPENQGLVDKYYNQLHKESYLEAVKSLSSIILYYLAYKSFLRVIFFPLLLILIRIIGIKNSINEHEVSGKFDASKVKKLNIEKKKFILSQQSNLDNMTNRNLVNYNILTESLGLEQFCEPTQFPLRFPLLVDNREKFVKLCKGDGLTVGLWFVSPVHPKLNWEKLIEKNSSEIPNATYLSNMMINLPLGIRSQKKLDQLIKIVKLYK